MDGREEAFSGRRKAELWMEEREACQRQFYVREPAPEKRKVFARLWQGLRKDGVVE